MAFEHGAANGIDLYEFVYVRPVLVSNLASYWCYSCFGFNKIIVDYDYESEACT